MEKRKNMKKAIYIATGLICVALGSLGVALPIIPSVPFLMVSAICFGRSSEKLDSWFKNTKLYKNNLETFVNGQGMTRKSKVKVMSMITILMAVGFFIMLGKNLYVPCIILGCVWVLHIIYFCFGVKNLCS